MKIPEIQYLAGPNTFLKTRSIGVPRIVVRAVITVAETSSPRNLGVVGFKAAVGFTGSLLKKKITRRVSERLELLLGELAF